MSLPRLRDRGFDQDFERDYEHDRRCEHYNEYKNNLPYPVQYPSESWLRAHKDVIYDTTENWEKSDMLLRLGTIAVSYDLEKPAPHHRPPRVQSYAIKVAFKDRWGNPQCWRDLPYVQPNLTPYIHTIVEQLSTALSAEFVTRREYAQTTSELCAIANESMLSSEAALSVASDAMLCADWAAGVAKDAKLCIDNAVSVAEDAKSIAEEASRGSLCAIGIANDAVDSAAEANEKAESAISTADEAKSTAVEALLSAGEVVGIAKDAWEKADSVQGIALSALSASSDAMGIAIRARGDADVAVRMADYAIYKMPLNSDRFVQGRKLNWLNCGTATTVIEDLSAPACDCKGSKAPLVIE